MREKVTVQYGKEKNWGEMIGGGNKQTEIRDIINNKAQREREREREEREREREREEKQEQENVLGDTNYKS